MQINNQIKKITAEEVAELRKKIRRGDYDLISEMLDGLYKPITVKHMILGYRNMKPLVYEAANRLIETIENLKNEIK